MEMIEADRFLFLLYALTAISVVLTIFQNVTLCRIRLQQFYRDI